MTRRLHLRESRARRDGPLLVGYNTHNVSHHAALSTLTTTLEFYQCFKSDYSNFGGLLI